MLAPSATARGGCEKKKQPSEKPKKATEGIDLEKLKPVNVDELVANGFKRGKADPKNLIEEAQRQIQRIKSKKGYTREDVFWLSKPWQAVCDYVPMMSEGKPLPEVKLFVHAMRNGVTSSGEIKVFKGSAKRAVELIREIGLKDTANGQRWSRLWGVMDRVVTPLGMTESGDVIIRVDCVLGMNIGAEWVFKQIYNVRTIERYAEFDLGKDCYVVFQDLIRDDSEGAEPRAPTWKERSRKPYHPVEEQVSITIIHGNGDGTFTLGNFMASKGQPLEAVSVLGKIFGFFVDLQKQMKKDTIKNRQKWDIVFQEQVLKAEREAE